MESSFIITKTFSIKSPICFYPQIAIWYLILFNVSLIFIKIKLTIKNSRAFIVKLIFFQNALLSISWYSVFLLRAQKIIFPLLLSKLILKEDELLSNLIFNHLRRNHKRYKKFYYLGLEKGIFKHSSVL